MGTSVCENRSPLTAGTVGAGGSGSRRVEWVSGQWQEIMEGSRRRRQDLPLRHPGTNPSAQFSFPVLGYLWVLKERKGHQVCCPLEG